MTIRCTHDPRERAGMPIGMYHCPECGCMVLAGLPHPPCDDEPACWLNDDERPEAWGETEYPRGGGDRA